MNVKKWLDGFRYAYDGLKYALSSQRNMKFHFFISFLVLLLALILGLSRIDIMFILLAITLVVLAELFNTAIEKAIDLAMPDIHPLAKIAKDVSAGAVLVSAMFAVVVGMMVFYEPLDRLFRHIDDVEGYISGSIWVLLALVIFSVIVIETRFSDRGQLTRPSLLSAVAFSLSTLITVSVWNTLVFMLSYCLAFLIMLVLYDKTNRKMSSLILGAMIGTFITLIAYYITG